MNTPIIKVMYRAQCFAAAAGYGSEYDVENINIPTLIISISSMDTKVPNILERHKKENKNIISVIYSQFDDIDSCTEVHGEIPMMQSDAKHIVDGIEHNINRIQQIIVHCDAGYSRSPAIAAAIAKAFGMDDEKYFSGGRYCPNRHVYRTMLNEFAERGYFD